MATTAARHRSRHPAPDVPDDGRVPLLRGPRPGAVLRGPRPRHDPPRRRPGGGRGRRRGGDARRRLHLLHVPRPQPHARPGRADGADLRRAVRARDGPPRRQGRLDAPDQRRARRDGLVRHRRRPPADRARRGLVRPVPQVRARSRSASSATGRPTSGRSTRRSTWPRSGRRRSCSSARTTSTWSTPPIGDVTAVEHPAADRARAYGLESIVVDGNDVEAVHAGRARPPSTGRGRATARRSSRPSPTATAATRGPIPASTGPTTRWPPGRRATRSRPTARGSMAAGVDAADLDAIDGASRATRSPRPRPRRGRRPSPAPDVLETQVWATEARRGGTDLPRGHRRRASPRRWSATRASCSSARTSARPAACSS